MGFVDKFCQARQSGLLEDGAQCDFGLEVLADSGDDLSGEEGVAAEVEEVVEGGDMG